MSDRKYGICLQPCTIQLMPIFMNNTGCLSAGSLFQIQQRNMNCTAQIKRVDYNNKKQIIYENETYICDSKHFKEIDHQLFLLLLSVKQEKRYELIQNEPLLNFIKNLRINQRVTIPNTSFHGRQKDLDCVVRYIGPVPEIGLGIFFGFIIIDQFDSIPPRGTLGQKYLRCDNSKGFLRSCDVFHKRSQPHNQNKLKSFPSVSSLDPFGSMESLTSERSFSSGKNRRPKNRNSNMNNTRNKGMPLYNANETGMNLINFEPVHHNFIQPTKSLNPTRPIIDNINNLGRNFFNNDYNSIFALPTRMSAPLEYNLPYSVPKLNFTSVPNNLLNMPKSNSNANQILRQKYELLKKELDILKNNKINHSNEAAGATNHHVAASRNQTHVVPQKKYMCSLKSCNINKPKHMQLLDNNYHWDGNTEFYTNSIHQVKCSECHQMKLKCYTSKANQEYNAFITLLKEKGFNVSVPENKYLAVTNQDKTKVIDYDKKREAYYECTLRANITINKNRFKSKCQKCGTGIDTSQGISLVSCYHVFCNNCIKAHIISSETPVMKCPIATCAHKLVENEIHAFMSETEFQIHLQKLRKIKFNPDDKLFYCKNTLCCGCIEINRTSRDKIVLLCCPECGQFNCIDCNAIHTGITCEEYQRKNNTLNMTAVVAVTTINTGARSKAIIFKCKTGKCRGYLHFQPNEAINFKGCPECGMINCRSCEDIHTDSTCREYQRDGTRQSKSQTDCNDDGWVCSNCTFIHIEKMKNCRMCLNQRMPIPGFDFIENELINEFSGSEDNDDIESISSMDNQYEKMLELEDMDIIRNTSKFECITCFDQIDVGKGVKLHDCLHEFCEECLIGLIKASDQAPITCPFRENDFVCEGTIQHREMKYLVDDDMYEQYLYRSLLQAQKDLKNCFQCKTPDCRGMWEYDDNVSCYKCPLCGQVNCHQCNAVHGTMSCREYQEKVFEETNPDALATRKMYEEMFASGKALHCPQCKIVIAREEGCSWVLCIICKTEICWATRGPRWGPKGNGDTSGGCKCDYKNGKRCHKDCGYCH